MKASPKNRTEEQLKAERQQLESFFRNAADSMIVFDLEGHILQVNDAFEKIFGWTRQEVVGQKLPTIPQRLILEMEKIYEEVRRGRQILGHETAGYRKDGKLLDISVTYSPVRNAKGKVVAISGIARDITERKKKDQEQKRLVAILEATSDFVATADTHGRVLYYNRAAREMLGIGEYEDISNITVPETHPEWATRIILNEGIPTAAREGMWSGETAFLNREGKEIAVWQVIIAHKSFAGEVEYYSTIARDISIRKQTEEFLRKSDKLAIAGQLAAGVAHEIRNPLTVLKGFVQLLQPKIDKKFFDIMISELDRINLIVSELLVLAKPQALHFQYEEMHTLLQDVVVLLDTQAIMSSVQIITEVASEVPPIKCERNQIKQVFINILKNAIEAMPSGGDIRIQVARQDAGNVLIRFIDQGEGIPQERLCKLGEPFYSNKEKGTGIGLTVSYKIIKDHRGSIQIISQVGKGTTVDIVLPISSNGDQKF